MSKAGLVLGALLLAGATLPAWAQPAALTDADLLYCARAYAEGAPLLKSDPDARVRRSASDARARARALEVRDSALLAEDPARHQQASTQARQRLAALPAAPPEARRLALRAAYLECRYLEAGSGKIPATAPAPAPATATATATAAKPVVAMTPTPEPVAVPAAMAVAAQADRAPAAAPAHRPQDAAPPLPPGRAGSSTTLASSPGSPTTGTASPQSAAMPATVIAPATIPGPAPLPRKDRVPVPAAAAIAASPSVPGSPSAVAAGGGLGDAELLYCAQVYGEVATTFSNDKGEAAAAAQQAQERWRELSEREHDLLNDHPDRHFRALGAARQRLAGLPGQAGRVRHMALRTAYEECLGLEARVARAARPGPGGDRLHTLARRNFCRDLLMQKLQVSPRVRAGFSPSELAALEEIRKIGEALAQPMPGAPLTLEQDREANQLARQFRDSLDRATADWSGGPNPVAQALARCHDEYAQGMLGGPDVLSPAADVAATPVPATPPPTAAAATTPRAPVIRTADLGPVFHMREVTPAGSIDGIWVRRGRSNLYDGLWVQAATGQMQRDVLEVRGIVDGELTIYRQGYRGSYRARVRADGGLEPGTATWFDNSGYTWGALPSQPVRGVNLGAIVHMREVTPQGPYHGIWRQRGQTGVYDVLWVFLPTGEITADVLAVTGAHKGRLIIRRENSPGPYPARRRTEAAASGRQLSQWEVLPAQSLRLGKTSR